MAFKGILIFCIGIHLLEVSDHLYSPRKKNITLKSGEKEPAASRHEESCRVTSVFKPS